MALDDHQGFNSEVKATAVSAPASAPTIVSLRRVEASIRGLPIYASQRREGALYYDWQRDVQRAYRDGA
jgi:hypothetical protein